MSDKPDVPAGARREVIKLLRNLDPGSRPTFHGHAVDRTGLTELAAAAAAGDPDAQTPLDELYELRVIGDLSTDDGLAEVESEWHRDVELMRQLVEELGLRADPLLDESVARALRGQPSSYCSTRRFAGTLLSAQLPSIRCSTQTTGSAEQ